MYSIYAEVEGHKVCVHNDSVVDGSVKVSSPVLNLEDSAAGSLTFTLAPNNVAYGEYTVEEKRATGISNYGSNIELVNTLIRGDINQNGEVIESNYALISPIRQKESANSLLIRSSAPVSYSDYQTQSGWYPGDSTHQKYINSAIDLSESATPMESIDLYSEVGFRPVFFSYTGSDFTQGKVVAQGSRLTIDEEDTKTVMMLLPDSIFHNGFGSGYYHQGTNDIFSAKFKLNIITQTEKDVNFWYYFTDSEGKANMGSSQASAISNARFVRKIQSSNGAYWIQLEYSDGTDFDPEDITSLELELEISDVAKLEIQCNKYDYSGGVLTFKSSEYLNGSGGTPHTDDLNSVKTIGLAYPTNPNSFSNYVTIAYRIVPYYYSNGRYIKIPETNSSYYPALSGSMFTARFGITRASVIKVHEYMPNSTIKTTSVSRDQLHSFDENGTNNYRISIRYTDGTEITTSDLTSITNQLKKTDFETITKNLDLVGGMVSTITVNRLSWATSKFSNGLFKVISYTDLSDKFEQGWIVVPGGSESNWTKSIRSTEIIPIELTTSDYVTISASVRDHGVSEDADQSSTVRRPTSYYVHFYSGDTWLGVTSDPVESGNDAKIPASLEGEQITGVRIVVVITGQDEAISPSDVDLIRLNSTVSSLTATDILLDGSEVDSESTVTTKMLELTQVANDDSKLWSAQIDAQSRKGIAIIWGVAMYDANQDFLGVQRWVDITRRFDGIVTGTKYIRIIMRHKANADNPVDNPLSPSDVTNLTVSCFKIEKAKTEDEIWEGRVLSSDVDFYNCRIITCEGQLAYLNDTRQPPRIYDSMSFRAYITKLLDVHNSKVAANRRFVLGECWEPTKKKDDMDDSNEDISSHKTNFETTLELINSLVTDYGGHLRVRKQSGTRYLDWLEDYPVISNQVIRFGKNLLDFTRTYDMSKLCTAVYPTGTVLMQAMSSSVGDHVPKTSDKWTEYPNTLLYQDEDDRHIYMNHNDNLHGYLTVIANVEPEKTYYFSGRLHGGFVAYWITDSAGNFFNKGIEIAGNEKADTGFVDYVDKAITMPPGANRLWMCSFGSAIPLALKEQTEETTGLDQVLTIDEVNTDVDENGKVWHTKGSPYITNPDAVEKYGWIEHRLDLSNLEDKDALYNAAKTYLQNGQFEDMTLEVSAVDMNSLGVDSDFINLLDQVRVVSEPHGLDKLFPVTSIKIPLDDPAGQTFTLGNKNEQTLTGQNANSNTELLQQIVKAPSSESVVRTAMERAASAIANATSGSFINYLYDDDGHMKELIISENPPSDASDPTTIPNGSVWRWNNEGLAHSNGGYSPAEFIKDANIAITKHGQVIANEIMGHFVYGYLIGAGKVVIGQNIGDSAASIIANLPPDYRAEGKSAITIRDGGNNVPYVDMYGGTLRFGMIKNDSRDEHGRIGGWIEISAEPVLKPLVLESQGSNGMIILNARRVWVGRGNDGLTDVSSTVGSESDFTLHMSNTDTITVRNGMIIGYTNKS